MFLEKYGYGVEVPVLELLDPDRGLGAPSYYLQDANRSVAPRQSKNLNEERLEKVIHRKFAQALKMKQKTIEIDDQDIQYIAGDQKQEKYTDQLDFLQSFELFLLAHPGKMKDNKNSFSVTLAPGFASDNIGKALGDLEICSRKKKQHLSVMNLPNRKSFFQTMLLQKLLRFQSVVEPVMSQ